MTQSNLLEAYFRQPKVPVKLPSKGLWNHPGFFDLASDGSLAVCAMTAEDELNLKNPDLLMNGEAVALLLSSCVRGIKGDTRSLIMPDVNALMLAIKLASSNDSLDFKAVCPECKNEIQVERSISTVLEKIEFLNSEYSVTLRSRVKLFLSPHNFRTAMKQVLAEFEIQKLLQYAERFDTMTPEEKAETVGGSMRRASQLRFEFIADAVQRAVLPDGAVVEDRDMIYEFLRQLEADEARTLKDRITAINNTGISTTQYIKCDKCEHEFTHDGLYWNPSDFFG